MKDEIVCSLLKRRKKKISFLNESVDDLYEAEADEEFAELNADDTDEEEHDDSQAPIQGSPDDDEPEESDNEDEDIDISPAPKSSPSPSSSPSMSSEAPEDEDIPEETPDEDIPEDEPTEYENPLDNQYAVHFTLGDEISLASTGTQNSDKKTGVIDGYDPEGFYKVKWSDESTTNGLTDIALEELVKKTHESKCVCGHREFVTEDDQLVCDKCGRIQEGATLLQADKSRPKGQRIIRSEAHPVSTATKPSIAEAIRNALGKSIRENDDIEDEESTVFDKLKKLDNEFWTRREELAEDIEELGFEVSEINSEYVVVSSDEAEDDAYLIPIVGTSRTMTLDFDKARIV